MNGTFLITGAAGGFGKEFSRRVLEGGGRVVLTDKNHQAGTELCQAFQQVAVLHNQPLNPTKHLFLSPEVWREFLHIRGTRCDGQGPVGAGLGCRGEVFPDKDRGSRQQCRGLTHAWL